MDVPGRGVLPQVEPSPGKPQTQNVRFFFYKSIYLPNCSSNNIGITTLGECSIVIIGIDMKIEIIAKCIEIPIAIW